MGTKTVRLCVRARARPKGLTTERGLCERHRGQVATGPRASSFRLFIVHFFFAVLIPALIIFSHRTLAGRSECPRIRFPRHGYARVCPFVRYCVAAMGGGGSDRRNRTTRVCPSEKKRTPRQKNIRAA